jgi:predicted DNA-binding transcriptional regulator YafY
MFAQKELKALVLGIRLLKGWADDELIAAASQDQDKIKAVVPARVAFDLEKRPVSSLCQRISSRIKFSLVNYYVVQ